MISSFLRSLTNFNNIVLCTANKVAIPQKLCFALKLERFFLLLVLLEPYCSRLSKEGIC